MPPIRQLARLFQAVSHRDLEAAQQLAAEIADAEEKKGHPSAAQNTQGRAAFQWIKEESLCGTDHWHASKRKFS